MIMTKHPAIMGKHILSVCEQFLPTDNSRILDPFAGIGTTSKLLPQHDVVGVELEEEWAQQDERTICGDSLIVVPTLGEFDAVLTSPTYGNRMADDFEATEIGKRITYRHKLGRKLSEGTTSNLHFGRKKGKYEELHKSIWGVCVDALRPGGVFILNCKDFIANKQIKEVTQWHVDTLVEMGLSVTAWEKVPSRGMRFGANRELRVEHEDVVCLVK